MSFNQQYVLLFLFVHSVIVHLESGNTESAGKQGSREH